MFRVRDKVFTETHYTSKQTHSHLDSEFMVAAWILSYDIMLKLNVSFLEIPLFYRSCLIKNSPGLSHLYLWQLGHSCCVFAVVTKTNFSMFVTLWHQDADLGNTATTLGVGWEKETCYACTQLCSVYLVNLRSWLSSGLLRHVVW
jgi:hypothetical protein